MILTQAFRNLTSISFNHAMELLAGPPAASGAKVNLTTVMGIPAAYACNRVLAEGVAMLPLDVFERMEPRGRRKATEHPLYRILHSAPNPMMTSYKLRETMQGHLGFRGNAFAEIELGRDGGPRGLWPLRPDMMQRPRLSLNGGLIYPYILPDGTGVELPQHRVLHLKGLSDDGIWGLAPLTVFRESFGDAIAKREYGSRFFGNGARPGGVLQAKGKLSKDSADRMATSWHSAHGGLSMAHRVAVLEEGVEWKAVGMSNEDAQFVELQGLTLGEMARIFNIKPHKIGDLAHATFSNIEQQAIEHVTDTLMPWLVNWEQQMDKDLLLSTEQGRYYTKHLVQGLLRGDATQRAAFYAALWQVGALSQDDIRESEDLNPIPDGKGEDYYVPLNYTRLGAEPVAAIPATSSAA